MKSKTIYSIMIACICILFITMNTSPAKELRLTYSVHAHQADERGSRINDEKEVRSQITVGLGSSYYCIAEGKNETIYDFKNCRIIGVDGNSKTCSDNSLYSNIGFRYIEFYNRKGINAIVNEALRKSGDSETMFDIETIFGIEDPDSKAALIKENKAGDNYEYIFDGRVVVECAMSGTSLEGTDISLFNKFLIYQCRLHPKIRKSIISKKRIPQYLKYEYRGIDGKASSVELNLEKAVVEQNSDYMIPRDYTKIYLTSNDELTSIINDVMSKNGSTGRRDKDDYLKIVDELNCKGSYFDAALAVLECGLQTGQDLPEKLRETTSLNNGTDKRINMFFQACGAKDKKSAEKSLKTLKSIDRKGLTHGYVIDIMIADGQMTIGDYKNAINSFIKVLKENPYIAGVYKDLGNVFNSSYDTASAWQCWDTAKYLYRDHKMLKEINKYEKWLDSSFPEFFM